MTDIAYSFVGIDTAANGGPCQRIGRRMIPTRTQVYDPASFFGVSPTSLRPIAVPWTQAADQWGVAFPDGLLAAVSRVAALTPLDTTYLAEWQQFWDREFTNNTGFLVAVPATLPVGYTARLKRDWHYGSAQPVAPPFVLRTASGYSIQSWGPSKLPNGYSSSFVAFSAFSTTPNIGFNYFFSNYDTQAIGSRAVQVRMTVNGTWPSMPVGTMTLLLSHNPDGSDPGSTSNGATTDFTWVWTPSDFTVAAGAFTFNTVYDSGWMNAGAILPTSLGTLTTFKASWNMNGVTSPLSHGVPNMTTLGFSFQFRMSPRVDVPLPYTITNRGGVVGVGGTP